MRVKYLSNSSKLKQGDLLGPTSTPKVKGSLREHIDFWVTIGTDSMVLEIIKEGYKIPCLLLV